METPSQTEARERSADRDDAEFERIETEAELTPVVQLLTELLAACESAVSAKHAPYNDGEQVELIIAKDLLYTLGVPSDIWTIAEAVELVMERKKA